MDLTELRKKLDDLDSEMIRLLAKRMALAEDIGKLKKEKCIPLRQPEREKELMQKRKQLARQIGLREELVERICKEIIDESLRVEEQA